MLIYVPSNKKNVNTDMYKLYKEYDRSMFSFTENKEFVFYEGIYVYSEQKGAYVLERKSLLGQVGKEKIDIYVCKYNDKYELICRLGIILGIRCVAEDLDNIIMSIKNPDYFITLYTINLYCSHKVKNLVDVVPTNNIVSLPNIDVLHEGKWFATTKVDGETCAIAVLSNKIIAWRMKSKKIESENIIFEYPMENNDEERVFLGEYFMGNVYLFLECNDTYGDFHVDIAHMKAFISFIDGKNVDINGVKAVINNIKMNNIFIDDTYQKLAQKVNALAMANVGLMTDGIVFGNIKTKEHYKWKPVIQNTIDFYVYYTGKDMLLYCYIENKSIKRVMENERYRYSDYDTVPIKGTDTSYIIWKIEYNVEEFDMRYQNKVVECQYIDEHWIPYRIREDKTIPQYYNVATKIWLTIKNPILYSDLIKQ